MAYYDWIGRSHQEKEKKDFENFMENFPERHADDPMKVNLEIVNTKAHIRGIQRRNEELEKKLEEYHNFFKTLSSLLPEKFDRNTRIG